MEHLEALSEMNWSSFNETVSVDEAEFMSQLLGTTSYPFTNERDRDPSFGFPVTFWSGHEATNMVMGDNDSYSHCPDKFNSSLNCLPQGNINSLCVPNSNCENYYVGDANAVPEMNGSFSAMNLCTVNEQNASSLLPIDPDNPFEETVHFSLPNQKLQSKRKFEALKPDKAMLEMTTNPSPKKRIRATGDVRRSAETTHLKKNKKVVSTTDEEESNAALNGHSTSSYSSEDDSNASQEINGGTSSSSKGSAALNSNGKARANRGLATDPQSLYARKRRERINERLRILQNLVPNGTKVDISTMLEEAVQYVKFLQLQIKLLSSDDLWMYAPIAYNGMDIGLNFKNSAPR